MQCSLDATAHMDFGLRAAHEALSLMCGGARSMVRQTAHGTSDAYLCVFRTYDRCHARGVCILSARVLFQALQSCRE
jgi:hypothetical protein